MKKALLGIVLFFTVNQYLAAQTNNINTTGKFGSQIFLSDVYGRAFENKYTDINGTAYFMPEYKFATIVLSDGRKFDHVKAKLNLLEHEVVFIASNGAEGYIGKGMVHFIYFYDTTSACIKTFLFASGFPKIDNQSNINFYQVLNIGTANLLKYINKNMEERGNELSGEKYKEFITRENLYFVDKELILRVKKDKAFFAQLFKGNADVFNQFILEHKINFKTEEQLIQLVDFYNSLKHPVY